MALAVVAAAGCQSGQLYQSAFESAALVPHITSLMVVQDGNIMREAFYAGTSAATPHDLHSLTKTVTALVGGIASTSCLVSLDQPIGTVLDNAALGDAGKAAITVRQLLSMTSGFQWDEAADAPAWAAADDQVDFVLARPITGTPGKTFDYDSGAYHLVSAVIDHGCARTSTFAMQRLFSPLGIATPTWAIDKQGIANGATGLQLSTTDLAAIGQLILDRGEHQLITGGVQVVAADFIDRMTRAVSATSDPAARASQYGLGLWVATPAFSKPYLLGEGEGGQFLFLVPDANAVVIATTDVDGVDAAEAARTDDALYSVIVNQLLPTL
ncbi:MAG TPA: serine hydrolase [Kofleriaceae bacterium]|nr:serine hydrolase [Kofleriaceae bacterium]